MAEAMLSRSTTRAIGAISIRRRRFGMSEERIAFGRRVDDLALQLLGDGEFWRVYRSLAILPNLLAGGEEVVDLTSAQLLWGPGLMVLTSSRILFVRYRMSTWRLSVKSIPYESIDRFKLVNGRRFPRIVVYVRRPGRRRPKWREFYRLTPPESGERMAGNLETLRSTSVARAESDD